MLTTPSQTLQDFLKTHYESLYQRFTLYATTCATRYSIKDSLTRYCFTGDVLRASLAIRLTTPPQTFKERITKVCTNVSRSILQRVQRGIRSRIQMGIAAAGEKISKIKLSLQEILGPAAKLAEEGVPIPYKHAIMWDTCQDVFRHSKNAQDLLIDSKAPAPGDIIYAPKLAKVFKVKLDFKTTLILKFKNITQLSLLGN
ncbi:UNVERIFIED_CONTAM: hypothetical protein NCL1_38025 [Trichonephila clavipes]